MAVVVQKFGGSSVANAERIKAAARRAIRAKQAGKQVVVVVSARGDTTDDLINLAQEISEQPPAREMDMLLATGEQISIALMAMAIHSLGEQAISFTGVQIGIRTDSTHTKARIREISTDRMRQALNEGKIVIVAGFQGVDEKYDITTLGRGGSDTTAVALAAALKVDSGKKSLFNIDNPGLPELVECEIYTDVDGVYTTDPRLVPKAQDGRHQLRRNARTGEHGRWRDALAFHRVCEKVRRAVDGPFLVQRCRGNLDSTRSRMDARDRRLRRCPG